MFGKGTEVQREALSIKMEQLTCRANDVIDELQHAEIQPGKKRKREVDFWLKNVQRKLDDMQSVIQKMQGAGYLANVTWVREAESMVKMADELLEQGRFPQGLVLHDLKSRGIWLPVPKLQGQTSQSILENIWNCLINEDESGVGICGIGGVGKTTVAKHINNRIFKSSSPFNQVYWITVSKDTSLYKLQTDLARRMELDLSKFEDERIRASLLHEAFKKREKSIIIFDDVWEPILMEDLGIPVAVGICKLLITSRSHSVCRRMNCKIIVVAPLPIEEAWNLFMHQLENYAALSDEAKKIARPVAAECDGLPLGITVIATCMRGVYDINEWKATLTALRDSAPNQDDIEDKVYRVLNFSYIHLKNDRLQQCFLCCALFPEDFLIPRKKLIDYFIAEQLVDVRRERLEQFNEGHAMLNRLEYACLLEPTKDFLGHRYVKMHDLVRDMAINVMKKTGAMIKAGRCLRKLPREDNWTVDLTRISLMQNEIVSMEPLRSPKCPNLSILLLQKNPLRSISNSFFSHMTALSVLDLSWTKIESTPGSISELRTLSALFLQDCRNLRHVHSLAKLKELKKLNLSHTAIEKMPHGMDELVNLRCLDLRVCQKLESFPGGLLPRSSNLESLMLPLENGVVDVEEMMMLQNLDIFHGFFSNLHCFNKYVRSKHYDKLNCYLIGVGCCSIKNWVSNYPYRIDFFSNNTVVFCFNSTPHGEGTFLLPHSVGYLLIMDCCFEDMPRSLWDGTPSLHRTKDLKRCILKNCHGLEHIVSCQSLNRGTEQDTPLQGLEGLDLEDLPDFDSLIEWVIVPSPCHIFYCLKELFVLKCPKIRKLIPLDLLIHHLPNLKSLTVEDCEKMGEIFATLRGIYIQEGAGGTDHVPMHKNTFVLPNLGRIWLCNLPALTAICQETIICNSLKEVRITGCENLKKNTISIQEATLERKPVIRASKCWWESCEWDDPSTKNMFRFVPREYN